MQIPQHLVSAVRELIVRGGSLYSQQSSVNNYTLNAKQIIRSLIGLHLSSTPIKSSSISSEIPRSSSTNSISAAAP
jgi:hypothetical protein